MERELFEAVVAQAMLAPSAHNTQPVAWHLEQGHIDLTFDSTRALPIGDPTGRDLNMAGGAAIECTVLSLARQGLGSKVEYLKGEGGPFARVTVAETARSDDESMAALMSKRVTHRLGFAPIDAGALDGWHAPHMTLITGVDDIAWLSTRIDVASARILGDRAFRDELLSWMRLRRSHPAYGRDGLNREILGMDAVTAALTKPVLGTTVYDLLARFGLGPALAGEAARSKTATAIALFHWKKTGSPLDAGRAFYRMWLEATRRGLAGWPAASLADDAQSRDAVSSRFSIPTDRVLFNAIRLGATDKATPSRTRLPVSEVIV
jgi:hypothetical protein